MSLSIGWLTLILFGSFLFLLALGLPISFALGGVSLIFILWQMGPSGLYLAAFKSIATTRTIIFISVPLFVFMANVLEGSGVAEDLFNAMHKWSGRLRGGLAIGTVGICTLFAAMSGVSATGTVTMGVIALPAMLKRKYDKTIAIGSIMAGGALGPLIPPSIIMIIYGLFSGVSVGKLFTGGILPGLLLAFLFCAYIAIRSFFQPNLCPGLPPEERVGVKEKVISLKAIILPSLLVLSVLGSIFGGLATPTEAASVGALGSLACAAVYGRLNWKMVKGASYTTLKLLGMIMWIMISAGMYTIVFNAMGAGDLIKQAVQTWPVSPFVILILMQLSYFILGCMVDSSSMLILTAPVYLPLLPILGIDPLWFGILFVVNAEMGYLTPPFGANLFYMKGVAPPEITIGDIYRSIIPFVALQAVGLAIVMLVPGIATWLPNLLFPVIKVGETTLLLTAGGII